MVAAAHKLVRLVQAVPGSAQAPALLLSQLFQILSSLLVLLLLHVRVHLVLHLQLLLLLPLLLLLLFLFLVLLEPQDAGADVVHAYLPEHLCRDDVHFVHKQQTPLPAANLVHHTRTLLTARATESNHGVGGDGHPAFSSQPLLLIRREPAYDIAPQLMSSLTSSWLPTNVTTHQQLAELRTLGCVDKQLFCCLCLPVQVQ